MSSKNYSSKEDAINQLYATIKTKFEQDGVLQEVRCMLQSKMVTMMKGNSDSPNLVQNIDTATGEAGTGVSGGKDNKNDIRFQLLHQLIMEYFHWHGFQYSAEMFARESSCDNLKPIRGCMEGVLGSFEHKSVPILLEIVSDLLEKKQNEQKDLEQQLQLQ